jgi:hypothetical protein
MIKNVKLKVVGVTFANENGINRQDIIKGLNIGDKIIIHREPTNRYDTNAIAVFSENGQIGYVGKDYASILAPMMDVGTQFDVKISDCGEYKNKYYASIIINEIGPKDSTELSGGRLW